VHTDAPPPETVAHTGRDKRITRTLARSRAG